MSQSQGVRNSTVRDVVVFEEEDLGEDQLSFLLSDMVSRSLSFQSD